jgi:hypothetical protein
MIPIGFSAGFQADVQVESICHLEKCIKRSIAIALFQSAYGRLLGTDNPGNLCLAEVQLVSAFYQTSYYVILSL